MMKIYFHCVRDTQNKIIQVEGSYNNHLVPLPDHFQGKQNRKHGIKCIVQMLSKHWRPWGIDHLSRKTVSVLGHAACSLEIQTNNSAVLFSHYLKNFQYNHFLFTVAKAAITTSSTNPSLSTNNKSWRPSFLVGTLNTCDNKLSSTKFRNFPDLHVMAVWYSQMMSRKLKSPVRTRTTNSEISCNCL